MTPRGIMFLGSWGLYASFFYANILMISANDTISATIANAFTIVSTIIALLVDLSIFITPLKR